MPVTATVSTCGGAGASDGTSWPDVAASAQRVVRTEHDSAERDRLQRQNGWSCSELEQTVVSARTSW